MSGAAGTSPDLDEGRGWKFHDFCMEYSRNLLIAYQILVFYDRTRLSLGFRTYKLPLSEPGGGEYLALRASKRVAYRSCSLSMGDPLVEHIGLKGEPVLQKLGNILKLKGES